MTATTVKISGSVHGRDQANFSIRTFESFLTRLMRTVKLSDMKKPQRADPVINLQQSFDVGEQLMGGAELAGQCRILRFMVGAIMNEDVSSTDLQEASAEIKSQRQLMDDRGQTICAVKPLLQAMLVLPAGSWMSEKVVAMATVRKKELGIEAAMTELRTARKFCLP